MSINELDMKVDQIRELKRMIEKAEAEITSIGDSIKATMTEQDTDELRGEQVQGHLEDDQHNPDRQQEPEEGAARYRC